eukprot:Colp12_sorted_trinity150504_noHs@27451
MFKKPFHVKSNTTLRGSDKKKLRTAILTTLQKQRNVTEEQLETVFSVKDDITAMKVLLHNGSDALIYNFKGKPLFFEVEQIIYPTVYFLWALPDAVPSFPTWKPVFEKLAGGADLMLPGVPVPKDKGI